MTIERHCHAGTEQPVRGAAIATSKWREVRVDRSINHVIVTL